jgi:hypothetical protein
MPVFVVGTGAMKKSKRLFEYVPPKSKVVRAFAREVCEELARRTDDNIYIQPHVISGLAGFLELAARVQARRLNEGQLVDSDPD